MVGRRIVNARTGVRFSSVAPMSKNKEIKDMIDDEFVSFLKKSAKNMKQAVQIMEKNYEKGMQLIIDFWKDR